jgi:hypothetical protein
LQKKHPDVTFIGVSIWEKDPKKVKPFVQEWSDKMGYRVATDDVPEGGDRLTGVMAKTWMDAGAREGIPSAFIIDAQGRVAWVGYPMDLDKPLDQILQGKWDLAAAAKRFKLEADLMRRASVVTAKLAKVSGDDDAKVALLQRAIVDDPTLAPYFASTTLYTLLRKEGAAEKAVSYGEHLVATVFRDNADGLDGLASVIVYGIYGRDNSKVDARFGNFALRVALRADELTKGKDFTVADTLAAAYFVNGDTAKAVESQERALKLLSGTESEKNEYLKSEKNEYLKAELKAHLEKYKKALKKE